MHPRLAQEFEDLSQRLLSMIETTMKSTYFEIKCLIFMSRRSSKESRPERLLSTTKTSPCQHTHNGLNNGSNCQWHIHVTTICLHNVELYDKNNFILLLNTWQKEQWWPLGIKILILEGVTYVRLFSHLI